MGLVAGGGEETSAGSKGDGEDQQGVEFEIELALEFFGVGDATSDAKEKHESNGEQE